MLEFLFLKNVIEGVKKICIHFPILFFHIIH